MATSNKQETYTPVQPVPDHLEPSRLGGLSGSKIAVDLVGDAVGGDKRVKKLSSKAKAAKQKAAYTQRPKLAEADQAVKDARAAKKKATSVKKKAKADRVLKQAIADKNKIRRSAPKKNLRTSSALRKAKQAERRAKQARDTQASIKSSTDTVAKAASKNAKRASALPGKIADKTTKIRGSEKKVAKAASNLRSKSQAAKRASAESRRIKGAADAASSKKAAKLTSEADRRAKNLTETRKRKAKVDTDHAKKLSKQSNKAQRTKTTPEGRQLTRRQKTANARTAKAKNTAAKSRAQHSAARTTSQKAAAGHTSARARLDAKRARTANAKVPKLKKPPRSFPGDPGKSGKALAGRTKLAQSTARASNAAVGKLTPGVKQAKDAAAAATARVGSHTPQSAAAASRARGASSTAGKAATNLNKAKTAATTPTQSALGRGAGKAASKTAGVANRVSGVASKVAANPAGTAGKVVRRSAATGRAALGLAKGGAAGIGMETLASTGADALRLATGTKTHAREGVQVATHAGQADNFNIFQNINRGIDSKKGFFPKIGGAMSALGSNIATGFSGGAHMAGGAVSDVLFGTDSLGNLSSPQNFSFNPKTGETDYSPTGFTTEESRAAAAKAASDKQVADAGLSKDPNFVPGESAPQEGALPAGPAAAAADAPGTGVLAPAPTVASLSAQGIEGRTPALGGPGSGVQAPALGGPGSGVQAPAPVEGQQAQAFDEGTTSKISALNQTLTSEGASPEDKEQAKLQIADLVAGALEGVGAAPEGVEADVKGPQTQDEILGSLPDVDAQPLHSLQRPTGGLLSPRAALRQKFRAGLDQRYKDGTLTDQDAGNRGRELARDTLSPQDRLVLVRAKMSPKDRRMAAAAAKIKAKLDRASSEATQANRVNRGEKRLTQRDNLNAARGAAFTQQGQAHKDVAQGKLKEADQTFEGRISKYSAENQQKLTGLKAHLDSLLGEQAAGEMMELQMARIEAEAKERRTTNAQSDKAAMDRTKAQNKGAMDRGKASDDRADARLTRDQRFRVALEKYKQRQGGKMSLIDQARMKAIDKTIENDPEAAMRIARDLGVPAYVVDKDGKKRQIDPLRGLSADYARRAG